MSAETIAAGVISSLIFFIGLTVMGWILRFPIVTKAAPLGGWLFRHRLRWPTYVPSPQQLSIGESLRAEETIDLRKTQPQVDFYENRAVLNTLRGGLQTELESVESAWLATNTGIYAANLSLFETKKIKRLLLTLPDQAAYLKTFVNAVPNWSAPQLADIVRDVTAHAQSAGTEVRWYDGPIMSALFGDPESPSGWVRVEVFTPHYADRMGFLLPRESYESQFLNVRAAFESQWAVALRPTEAVIIEKPSVRDELGDLLSGLISIQLIPDEERRSDAFTQWIEPAHLTIERLLGKAEVTLFIKDRLWTLDEDTETAIRDYSDAIEDLMQKETWKSA